ncbi:glycosyl transferase family group 2-domain-containing protein [Plectosphaerella cucumerina]|uniref:Glycosyl transferase family group 2-domain-containing protein n=1 Tax=Plectosphaerella cucumerina TaxID=40658 RepID=A0A8K0TDA4_9PEZI|nr:glycosyl transferase family group 2-domain-containing protein [Plectosphaerella cucumerina]
MSLFTWYSRRAGGLAMIFLTLLCYWVISKEAAASRSGYDYHQHGALDAHAPNPARGEGYTAHVFAYYCLFIHVLTFIFPMRSCYAMFDITRSLKKVIKNRTMRDFKVAPRRRNSSTSLSSAETLTSSHACSSASSEAGDIDLEPYTDADPLDDTVIHAIIIPNYKEEVDTLRETLDVLASHPQARGCYDIYLAMEIRETNVELKAGGLVQEYLKKFRSIDYTLHPSDIPGESAGKGSNMAWAARRASERYPLETRKDVIITGIDADSHLLSNYTTQITTMHHAYPETAGTTLYSAPIIFDRNAHEVPALVRVADILWAGCGLSGLYNGSSIAPPTSVYSVPLSLADQVGGWDCDADAIGEDLHMYIKCFFALNGNLTNRTVFAPVSQSNITSDGAKGLHGVYAGVRARYRQALRHMWGALDTGFTLRKLVELWQERKHTARAYRPMHAVIGDETTPYIPETELGIQDPAKQPTDSGIFADVTQVNLRSPDWERIVYMLHRVFEAHFLPMQTAILVIASTLYVWVAEGNGDPHGLGWVFDLSNVLRTLGFMEVGLLMFLYEQYHDVCVTAREREMKDAGLHEGMCFSKRQVKKNFVDYMAIPLVAPLYGSIPTAQAQISQLWTQDLVYTVSTKVVRQRVKTLTKAEDMA